MRKKILIFSFFLIVYFTFSLAYSVDFESDNVTIFQIFYIALLALIVFSQSYIILKLDPLLQKCIRKKHLLIMARTVIIVSFGAFIYLYDFTTKLLWQDKLMTLDLFFMLLPTIIMFTVLVLLEWGE
jgi:hypothetical protein